jgi:dienelactone hydrolase
MNDQALDVAVSVPANGVVLDADLVVPAGAGGLIIFAHGSGSSRHSSRNRHVARVLNEAGLGTLLLDLLTPDEEAIDLRTRHLRFDINLLAGRLAAVADWLGTKPETSRLRLGYFGASTGGGAALVAASQRPATIVAVVSRGGRPDLAGEVLPHVTAPTLLIVGGNDIPVIEMNENAMRQMRCEVRLEIVPGATHLFEEPGALEQIAALAREWFERVLGNSPSPNPFS